MPLLAMTAPAPVLSQPTAWMSAAAPLRLTIAEPVMDLDQL